MLVALTPFGRYGRRMRLAQDQIWKKDDEYLRIVEWARMSIVYKLIDSPTSKKGTLHKATKKEFCRLLKGAELVTVSKAPPELPEEPAAAGTENLET